MRVVQMLPGPMPTACFHQRQCRRAGGNIAANHVNVRVVFLHPAHALDHAMAVAMRRIHHNRVHAGTGQGFHTLFRAHAHAHGRAHTQLAQGVARGVWKTGLFGDVLDCDEALELEVIIDDQQALDLVLVEQHLGLLDGGAVGHRHQALARRHDQSYREVQARLETQVAPRHQADHLARIAHRKAGNAELLGQGHHLAHRVLGRDHHRVAQHTGLVALDTRHLGRLLLRREVLVHNADAALLRDRDGEARFGHGIHRGGNQRQIERDVAGKTGGEGGVLGQDLGVGRHQQHVVEGEGFADQAHVKAPNRRLYPWLAHGLHRANGALEPMWIP
jgi:hypothetical protein